ncbi:MAG: hypothetical protein JWQ71_417 [Pedosphaera sp.]|nr:hypothetical protein [Pedosphaera sp.]
MHSVRGRLSHGGVGVRMTTVGLFGLAGFGEVVEFLALFGGKLLANLFAGPGEFPVHGGNDGTPYVLGAFLTATENFLDVFVLFGSEGQLAIHAVKKFLAALLPGGDDLGLNGQGLVDFLAGTYDVIDEESAGYHARAKDHERGENNFPNFHGVSPT